MLVLHRGRWPLAFIALLQGHGGTVNSSACIAFACIPFSLTDHATPRARGWSPAFRRRVSRRFRRKAGLQQDAAQQHWPAPKAFSFSVQIRLNLWLKLFNSLGTGIFPDSSDLRHKCYRAERVMANSAHARWHVLRRNRFWRQNRWNRHRTSKLACRRSSQARDECRILFRGRCTRRRN
jgi:hypothetical protein